MDGSQHGEIQHVEKNEQDAYSYASMRTHTHPRDTREMRTHTHLCDSMDGSKQSPQALPPALGELANDPT